MGVKEALGSPLSFPSLATSSNHLEETKMKGCPGGWGRGKGQGEGHSLPGRSPCYGGGGLPGKGLSGLLPWPLALGLGERYVRGWGSGQTALPFPSDSYFLEWHMTQRQTEPQGPTPGEIT